MKRRLWVRARRRSPLWHALTNDGPVAMLCGYPLEHNLHRVRSMLHPEYVCQKCWAALVAEELLDSDQS